MRDRGIIYAGLLIFLALATYPAWHNLAAGVTARGPNVVRPARERQCVAPLEYMRASHMKLLIDWRDGVVRRGQREFASADGRRFTMSLTSTCLMQCHTAKQDFCDRCHTYASVTPTCWNCHLDAGPAATPVLARRMP